MYPLKAGLYWARPRSGLCGMASVEKLSPSTQVGQFNRRTFARSTFLVFVFQVFSRESGKNSLKTVPVRHQSHPLWVFLLGKEQERWKETSLCTDWERTVCFWSLVNQTEWRLLSTEMIWVWISSIVSHQAQFNSFMSGPNIVSQYIQVVAGTVHFLRQLKVTI